MVQKSGHSVTQLSSLLRISQDQNQGVHRAVLFTGSSGEEPRCRFTQDGGWVLFLLTLFMWSPPSLSQQWYVKFLYFDSLWLLPLTGEPSLFPRAHVIRSGLPGYGGQNSMCRNHAEELGLYSYGYCVILSKGVMSSNLCFITIILATV